MKICILGKYPPIEGGVSTHTFWMARGLAERGHEVHVVTNADEVEPMFRMSLEPSDQAWYSSQFDATGGRVRVYNPEPYSRRAMGHIPSSNPFVTKLASVATEVVRRQACEVILAYYYEPYGMAGWLASRWTRRPLLVKHAGSDLDRLCAVPDLATAYKEVLRTADVVVTQPRLMPRFLGMGVKRENIQADVPYGVPRKVFNPQAQPLNVAALARSADGSEPQPYDSSLPTIGVYGKIGTSKGTFDLIGSLGQVARKGQRFNLLAMVGRTQGDSIASALHDEGLYECTYVVPMLPNWRVPEFIRACTAVCFLERDFPVEIHGPIIPREVLACGSCLVLSGEIAGKQKYRERFRLGENILVIEDPKNHEELAAMLGWIIADPKSAEAIGARGVWIADAIEDHAAYIDGWERLVVHTANCRPPDIKLPDARTTAKEGLAVTLPDLLAFLQEHQTQMVDAFLRNAPDATPRDTADRFCCFIERSLENDTDMDAEPTASLISVLRYARARVHALHDPAEGGICAFPVSDRLKGQAVTRETVGKLRPVHGSSVRIMAFDHDVSGLFYRGSLFGQSVEPAFTADRDELATLSRAPTLVLFQRRVNLIPCELRIDEPTRAIVEACDGSLTTDELVDHMCVRFGAETEAEREQLTDVVLAALSRLYRLGVIVFGERVPGGGWRGGVRLSELDPGGSLLSARN